MGIHYSYKNTRSAKAMEKQAKKGPVNKLDNDNTIPLDTVITLDHLTNPDKK